MRVDFRDERRVFLGCVEMDPGERRAEVQFGHVGEKSAGPRTLRWDNATDEKGLLKSCISCGCGELFVRKDFPQALGLGLVIIAGLLSVVLFATGEVAWSVSVLAAAVGVDSLIFYFTPKCIVCYRCRTEYHRCEIAESIEPWDLSIGEKYRPVRVNATASELGDES